MAKYSIDSLTQPGAPFELAEATVRGTTYQVFKNSLTCLTQLYSALDEYADNDLAVYCGRRLTYRQAANRAAVFAEYLKKNHGVAKDTRVAISMRNSPEWMVSFIAISSLGAVPVLVNSRGTAPEISYSAMSTKCELLITDLASQKSLGDTDASKLARVTFDLSKDFECDNVQVGFHDQPSAMLDVVESNTDDTALILFTAGTTGRPKGALLTHRGILTAIKTNQYSAAMIGMQMANAYGIDLETLAANRPQSCTLLMFPLFHVSGCHAVFLTNLAQGGKIAMLPRWDAQDALKTIQNEKVTSFPGVPTMYWDLLQLENRASYDVSSLASLSVAGQSTPQSLLNAIHKEFPRAVIGIGYGMTEANGAVSLNIGQDLLNTPDSVGLPVAITDICLMDDSGNRLATGERGEICIKSATLMRGYDNQPEANERAFHNGWYRSGDIGVFDEEGRLYIVDRSTEMVISGGENIYCAEVERVLARAPEVIETVTFGLPDERLGEKLVAIVRFKTDSQQTAEDVLKFASQSLANYKLPTRVLVINEPLPKNPTGKILKAKTKELYADSMTD